MKYLEIGEIVNTQGLRGEVRVQVITDFVAQRFQIGAEVTAFPKQGKPVVLQIDGMRRHKQLVILHFSGYDSINDVEFLKPALLKIRMDQQANDELEPGAYYYHQIIGLPVYDLNNRKLGQVKEILDLGPNDVWVVERPDQSDLLLPKIDQVIKQVDLEQSRIVVDLLEGLE
ncbi:16S rRNA processing protein RimM [Fructilactobacillus florum 8D]|uniref:Ribosome maturation factor RimM n=1 Tax=Fructilactobacillus florum 8D TaxID=1221538 RepID=W9EDQ2_9LACO|nr:ribosome maturation factor RimM [Fructilactobacillus florum]EKK20824.1 16S rRNA processing protein RimM [Fructilactobacillus florum 2F]ETO40212.1 16S rRNA processing protein RimM [Fructilactobacillus florum 8D]